MSQEVVSEDWVAVVTNFQEKMRKTAFDCNGIGHWYKKCLQ